MTPLFLFDFNNFYFVAIVSVLCFGVFIKFVAYFIRLKRAEDLQKNLRKNGGVRRGVKKTVAPVLHSEGRKIISNEGNKDNCISTARKRLERKTGKTFNLRLYRFDPNKCEFVLK